MFGTPGTTDEFALMTKFFQNFRRTEISVTGPGVNCRISLFSDFLQPAPLKDAILSFVYSTKYSNVTVTRSFINKETPVVPSTLLVAQVLLQNLSHRFPVGLHAKNTFRLANSSSATSYCLCRQHQADRPLKYYILTGLEGVPPFLVYVWIKECHR